MNKYLLLMRGDQSKFEQMSPEERKAMIQSHMDYSRHLDAQGVILDGDGLAGNSHVLSISEDPSKIQVVESPYAGTKEQLSGFYMIQAASQEDAVAIAKGCPALVHGETVEVIALGH